MATPDQLAAQAAQALGWSPTLVDAQWRLETGNFTSTEWLIDNNPAGIKWYPGMQGATRGQPAPDGGYYAHFSDPVQGYVSFVKSNPRYADVSSAGGPQQQAWALQADGWATDPAYAAKLIQLMDGQTAPTISTAQYQPPTGVGGWVMRGIWAILGLGLILIGLWAAVNPLSGLTTAIRQLATREE